MGRKMNNTMVDALLLAGGGVVGAGMALLFTPQSGRKNRRDLARFGKTVGKKSDRALRSFAGGMADLGGKVVGRGH